MNFYRPLFPHQEVANEALLERSPDATQLGIFLDMRLGKSMLMLRLWKAAGVKRALIAAPGMPIEDWITEAKREGWATSLRAVRGSAELQLVADNKTFPRQKGKHPCRPTRPMLVLTTHETLAQAEPATLTRITETFDAVAIDESTAIKNPKANLTIACLKYLTKAKYRAVLSGLPHPQDILEIWSQMAFIKGGEWMGQTNFWEWRNKYFYAPPFDPYSWRPTGASASQIRAAMHRDAVVMTAEQAGLKRTVVRKAWKAPMHPEAKKLSDMVKETWQWPGFGDDHAAKNSVVVAGWMHNLEGGCNPAGAAVPCWKPNALTRFLEGLDDKEAVVVWCNGQGEATQAMAAIKLTGRSHYLLNGTVDTTLRKDVLTEFREDAMAGDGPVIVLSPKLVKWGVDLSQANTQVWWSRPWSYEANRQAEARTMHPAKNAATLIMDFVTTGGCDEDVLEGIEERRENSRWYAERIAGPVPKGRS